MKIDYSTRFLKHLQRTSVSIQLSFQERLQLFITDVKHPLLHNHPLHGTWAGYRSINITGNWRAIYRDLGDGKTEWVEFVEIGTHSELYK